MPASAARSAWPGDSNEGAGHHPRNPPKIDPTQFRELKSTTKQNVQQKYGILNPSNLSNFQATTNCSQYQYFSISHSFYNQFTNNQTEIAFQFLRIICKSASAVCTSMIQFIAIKMVALRKSQYIFDPHGKWFENYARFEQFKEVPAWSHSTKLQNIVWHKHADAPSSFAPSPPLIAPSAHQIS